MASPKYDDYWSQRSEDVWTALQLASVVGSATVDATSLRALSTRKSWRGRGVVQGTAPQTGVGPIDPRPMAALVDLVARRRWLQDSASFEFVMDQTPRLRIRRIAGSVAVPAVPVAGPGRIETDDQIRAAEVTRETRVSQRPSPEAQAAEEAINVAAGRGRLTGQGFSVDEKSRSAVERYAMDSARRHFEQYGTVADTANLKSWDYEVAIDGNTWHVEVKGTTADPVDIILTPNEVAHAQTYEHVALYVVSNIDVQVVDGDRRRASGGRVVIRQPWTIDHADLRPLGYKYRMPEEGSTAG